MTSTRDLISNFLASVRQGIVNDLKSKKISDGDLGMKHTAEETSGVLTGYGYYYYLVHGRAPGKQPPVEAMLSWIQKRGIQPTDISQKSLAYLVARKIAREGTDIYTGKRPGLALKDILKERNEQFSQELREKYREDIKESIGTSLKQIFT